MMSPLSVATFLPKRQDLFDVVIFDEASQIKPEDALSAMLRARQFVVVGDSQQMPPTSFFDRLSQDDDIDDEDAGYDAALGKMESILALAAAGVRTGHRRRRLKWHYRSQHHELIQPSNRLFYDDELVVFPSPLEKGDRNLGLRFQYDPTSTYDRGTAGGINPKQAQQIAAVAALAQGLGQAMGAGLDGVGDLHPPSGAIAEQPLEGGLVGGGSSAVAPNFGRVSHE
jgi:superfamily I DNA and/or RNA helicase